MSTTSEPEAVVGSDLPSNILETRSPSVLAIVTCVLGLISLPSFLSPALWFLPVVTIVLGWIALYTLAKHPEKTGRKAVVIALGVSFFVGTLGPARYYSRQWWINRTARQFAAAWFDMIRDGRIEEAHQLHLARNERKEPDVSLQQFYEKTHRAALDRDAFFAKEPLKFIRKLGKEAKIEYAGSADYVPDEFSDEITLIYLVKYREDGQEKVRPMRLRFVRQRDEPAGDFPWFIRNVD